MKTEESKFYNALNITLESNYSELKSLLSRYDSWQKAWKHITGPKVDADKEWQKLQSSGIELRLQEDENFPAVLKEIPWTPFGLYIKGSFPEEVFKISVVGTRKATDVGRSIAKKIGYELSKSGVAVVSGLALGIDESAHKGAVEAGGKTIAVLAVGLDRVYPQQNSGLVIKILSEGGCIVSEYPIGAISYPNRFIERNRIISGLSSAVIVIEAPEKSGALATAKFALEQNREIFVVPGPIGHSNYVGSHELIRAGARLATSAKEVLEDLNLQVQPEKQNIDDLTEKQKTIFAVLEKAGVLDIDKISELLKIGIPELNREMTFLLLKGIIKEGGGKYYI